MKFQSRTQCGDDAHKFPCGPELQASSALLQAPSQIMRAAPATAAGVSVGITIIRDVKETDVDGRGRTLTGANVYGS